jgi:hypothetical protein
MDNGLGNEGNEVNWGTGELGRTGIILPRFPPSSILPPYSSILPPCPSILPPLYLSPFSYSLVVERGDVNVDEHHRQRHG